jgi:hypothetical protein
MQQLALLTHGVTPGLLIALSGSVWAVHRASCEVCSNVPKLFGYSLAWPGVIFYGGLLAWHLIDAEAAIKLPLMGTAYAHGILLVKMIVEDQICPACVLTAIGAIYAAKNIAQ